MTNVIHAQALEKKYGQHLAVDGIDLKVERGSIFGLVGPNGAGKTTILRMLVDIIRPTGGELTVLGETPSQSTAALRQRIGYLPGELKFNDRITGEKMLRHLARISGPVDQVFVDKLAQRLGVDLTRPVRALSKGNKQKIGLIQAFMHLPELLILDEPTSGLDPLMQREFLALVREARDNGQTVLLSSHILSEIQHAADQVAVLAQGKIVANDNVANLRLASVSRVRAIVAGITAEEARMVLGGVLEDVSAEATGSGELVSVEGMVRGQIDKVVKALARFELVDLSIEEPDLEESILDLYARKDAQR
ncbi:ABC transporter ATP-binding protein [Corynebacterium breve]|uniref:ABC transporter ATP-binding protein n=1 Tax=Corynebacterium breve TaxID=3049799 RepID=A0ABY8VE82_9CORY|nr:ABC transporter ATP-binding protein [Corynebacterium breve]WIM67784.1 ABC transporter ATP-binding protein [Corynebacterium breve]